MFISKYIKKGAAIDGIMKLFREEAAEGYSYFIVQCWFIFYILIQFYIILFQLLTGFAIEWDNDDKERRLRNPF